jgi:shikimate 5-dehydrogenase
MYFFGVTTGASAIRRIFPVWCRMAGVPDAELAGVDLAVGSERDSYRRAMRRVREDADACGALVTTHKFAVVEHAGDLIDVFDADARLLGEASCIVKRNGVLSASAPDVECSVWSLKRVAGRIDDLLILGAGGAGTALAVGVSRVFPGCRIHATDVSEFRLEKIRRLSGARTTRVARPEDNDAVLAAMPPGAIAVNATGMGKDLPGSPISDPASFPPGAVAWELNYRGDLMFQRQAAKAGVATADGWGYFLRGWSTVMSRVLGFELTDERFKAFCDVAGAERYD